MCMYIAVIYSLASSETINMCYNGTYTSNYQAIETSVQSTEVIDHNGCTCVIKVKVTAAIILTVRDLECQGHDACPWKLQVHSEGCLVKQWCCSERFIFETTRMDRLSSGQEVTISLLPFVKSYPDIAVLAEWAYLAAGKR